MTHHERPPGSVPASPARTQRRRGLVAAGGTLLALVGTLLTGAGPAQASTPSSYSFSQLFAVADTESQQGLAFADGVHYVSFDLGSGNGRIVAYDGAGTELERTGVLPLGHSNEVSVRTADGNLYVTNSSASTPVVDVVDMRPNPPALVKKIPVAGMTHGAVVAVDNAHDQLVMATGATGGPYSLVFTSMTGTQLRKVAIPDEGITQGLEVVDGEILLYTSLSSPARNQITVYSSDGDLLRVIPVPVASEGEGLSVNPATDQVYVGAGSANRVYKMSPAFVQEPAHASRTVTLTAVADTMARQQAPTTASGSLTTLLSDREETAGTASRATSYLRFTVPALASGESILAASLSLQVTNGTANGPAVWRTGSTWDEDTLTWGSGQPTRTGTSSVGNFGSMGVTRVGTRVTGVTTSGGVSFQLYADASDGMLFTSRETGTASSRPQLILTIRTS